MKTFTCTQSQSLRDFTDFNFPQGSFCFARLLRNKDIKVNGARVSKNIALKSGDTVMYYTTPKDESAITHTIVFEDENIIIVDKFSGVTTEGLCAELNTGSTFYAVHRLDRNTSGLLVFAKTKQAEGELLKAFREHSVQKTYIAVCKNNFKEDSRTLTAYLLKDEKNSLVKIYNKPVEGALKIITEYSVLQKNEALALLKIKLHTGRTHQIRAHMAYIGCSVLGDGKYGDEILNKKFGVRRQCLVAKKLQFLNLSGGLEYLNGFTAESTFKLSIEHFKNN